MLSTAAVFSSNMVLQRDKIIKIWGETDSSAEIICTLCDKQIKAYIKNGSWTAVFPPLPAGGPFSLSVFQADEQILFDNVMIGEVWLAGGQSNMEFELINSLDGKEILENISSANVRYYYTNKFSIIDDGMLAAEKSSFWRVASAENSKAWSAVAFHFAQMISQRLGVTVGIIGCNWGGTSAACWQSRERLLSCKETEIYIHEYDNAIKGRNENDMDNEYDAYVAYTTVWLKKMQELYAINENAPWNEVLDYCGEDKYPGPICPKSPYRPAGLYETMLKRVAPYTIKGFIYYQGEADEVHPESYYKLLQLLIEQWRSDFEDDSLAFMNVQLPMYIDMNKFDDKSWAIIRQAQLRIINTVKNTGIAIIPELGEKHNIHPKNKKPVGERLALQALFHCYNDKNVNAFSPIFNHCYTDGEKLVLVFDYTYKGLKSDDIPKSFEVAGADGIFYPAKAELSGDKIMLFSEKVSNPYSAKYAWANYAEVNVFNSENLPLSPFRTHSG